MKLSPYGHTARVLRMRLDLSLKEMADAMGISSSYLSGIEYGEKRLNEKLLEKAIDFFKGRATAEEIEGLRRAGEQSKEVIETAGLSPDARGLVAAFARRLQEGGRPSDDVVNWITNKKKGSK